MKYAVVFTLIILFIFSFPASAIDGYIQFEYDLMKDYHNGQLYLYETFFNNKLKVAGRFQVNLMQYTVKEFIPSAAPASQIYDLEISYKLRDNITLMIIEGCEHYFAQSNYSSRNDWVYLKTAIRYEF